jgi:hypothetical protein
MYYLGNFSWGLKRKGIVLLFNGVCLCLFSPQSKCSLGPGDLSTLKMMCWSLLLSLYFCLTLPSYPLMFNFIYVCVCTHVRYICTYLFIYIHMLGANIHICCILLINWHLLYKYICIVTFCLILWCCLKSLLFITGVIILAIVLFPSLLNTCFHSCAVSLRVPLPVRQVSPRQHIGVFSFYLFNHFVSLTETFHSFTLEVIIDRWYCHFNSYLFNGYFVHT